MPYTSNTNPLLAPQKYVVGGRNGYHGIDKYRGSSCYTCVTTERSAKAARATAGNLGSAYYDGYLDAQVGLTLPLLRPVSGYNSVTMAAGTMVLVAERNGGLFTVYRADGAKSSYVSLKDIRSLPEEDEPMAEKLEPPKLFHGTTSSAAAQIAGVEAVGQDR